MAALTKGNAANPQEIAKILTQSIKVGEDGSYHFTGDDGTESSIEDGAASWLKANAWAVKNTQKAGSGAGNGSGGTGGHTYTLDDLKSMTAEDINKNWTAIENSLGKQKG